VLRRDLDGAAVPSLGERNMEGQDRNPAIGPPTRSHPVRVLLSRYAREDGGGKGACLETLYEVNNGFSQLPAHPASSSPLM
jgi:hypothetical protein